MSYAKNTYKNLKSIPTSKLALDSGYKAPRFHAVYQEEHEMVSEWSLQIVSTRLRKNFRYSGSEVRSFFSKEIAKYNKRYLAFNHDYIILPDECNYISLESIITFNHMHSGNPFNYDDVTLSELVLSWIVFSNVSKCYFSRIKVLSDKLTSYLDKKKELMVDDLDQLTNQLREQIKREIYISNQINNIREKIEEAIRNDYIVERQKNKSIAALLMSSEEYRIICSTNSELLCSIEKRYEDINKDVSKDDKKAFDSYNNFMNRKPSQERGVIFEHKEGTHTSQGYAETDVNRNYVAWPPISTPSDSVPKKKTKWNISNLFKCSKDKH